MDYTYAVPTQPDTLIASRRQVTAGLVNVIDVVGSGAALSAVLETAMMLREGPRIHFASGQSTDDRTLECNSKEDRVRNKSGHLLQPSQSRSGTVRHSSRWQPEV